jgi:hypothetical protein
MEYEDINWINLAKNEERLCAILNKVMDLGMLQNAGYCCTKLLAFQDKVCLSELTRS